MFTTATHNKEDDIPDDIRKFAFQQNEKGGLPLTIGKRYVVSGVRNTRGHTFYLIIPDDNELSGRPWWFPAVLFEPLGDQTKPDDWVDGGVEGDEICSYRLLASDKTGKFMNDLEDGEDYAIAEFMEHYRRYAEQHGLWFVDGKPQA